MRSKAELFALFGESLTAGMIIWIVSVTLLQLDSPEPMPGLIFVLILTLINVSAFLLVLRKETAIPVLAVLSSLLLAGNAAALIFLYSGPIRFGYVLTVLLISGICVFVPLYYVITGPVLTKHLVFIDLSIFSLIWLFLFLTAVRVNTFSTVCAVFVALIDAGGAVCLRMSEGGMKEGIGKAVLLSMGAAGAAALVIWLLVGLFSRSGGVTGAVLNGFKAFLLKIWEGLQAFADWLSRFISTEEGEVQLDPVSSAGGISEEISYGETAVDPVRIAIVIGIIAVAAVIVLVIIFRKKKTLAAVRSAGTVQVARHKALKKRAGVWKKLLEKLIFIKNTFVYRNTPPGVLVWLERFAAKSKAERGSGESIRAFLMRMSPEGLFAELADDLDAALYGKGAYSLSAERCRQLRKLYKNEQKIKRTVNETAGAA